MSKKIQKQEELTSIKKKQDDRYPVFCFKYLQPYSYTDCTDPKFFIDFLERLQKLGTLGWKGINVSAKHSYGFEKLPITKLRVSNFPAIVTEDVRELTVFRANGNNLPFLGIRLEDTFQVIFIETNFGDIYNH